MIRFRCQCGQELKAYPLDRGKVIQCLKCGLSLRVPVDVADEEEGEYELTKPEEQSPKLDAETAAIPVAEISAPKIGRCPKCGAETHLGQTICTQCGIDFWTMKEARIIPFRRNRDYGSAPVEWSAYEFTNQFASSFPYPFKDMGLLMAVSLVLIVLAGIAAAGRILISPRFSLGVAVVTAIYFAAYAVTIVQSSLFGSEDAPGMPSPSREGLYIPLMWAVFSAGIFCGPGVALAVAASHVPQLRIPALVACSFGFVMLPMAILITTGAGDITLASLKGVFTSAARSAHIYLIFVAVVLLMIVVTRLLQAFLNTLMVPGSALGLIAPLLCTAAVYIISIYFLATASRALGILGRYREKKLDFGEGAAEPGINPALGAALVILFIAALSAGAHIALEALKP